MGELTAEQVVKQKWPKAWAEEMCGYTVIWAGPKDDLGFGIIAGHCTTDAAWADAAKRLTESK